jgi:hypothetical protein
MTPTNHVRIGSLTHFRLAQSILASGRVVSVTAGVSRSGLMVRSTMVNGAKTGHMAKVPLHTLMETSMTVSGPTIKPTVLAFTSMLTAHSMKACGKTTYNTERASRLGPTSQGTKETTLSEENMASAVISGTMDPNTVVTGRRIKSQALESTHGLMADDMKASGLKTIWKEWAFTSGTTAACTKVSTRMTKNMASAFIHGQTVVAMRATGSRASSTASAPILYRKTIKSNMVCGRTANVLSGLIRVKFLL